MERITHLIRHTIEELYQLTELCITLHDARTLYVLADHLETLGKNIKEKLSELA